MIRETVRAIRKWQAEGRETIAVICRDEQASAAVSRDLGRILPIADSDPETAEFTEGVMVLPVEYTKGLEFDAVVLFDPFLGKLSRGRQVRKAPVCGRDPCSSRADQ